MRFLYFDANQTDGKDLSKMAAIYEVAGRSVRIPADTDDNDIDVAVIHALVEDVITPVSISEARDILEVDRNAALTNIILDEILPFLIGRGFNPSPKLTALLAIRTGIRNKFPDGQTLPPVRKKNK